jgi:hypothetical protein
MRFRVELSVGAELDMDAYAESAGRDIEEDMEVFLEVVGKT